MLLQPLQPLQDPGAGALRARALGAQPAQRQQPPPPTRQQQQQNRSLQTALRQLVEHAEAAADADLDHDSACQLCDQLGAATSTAEEAAQALQLLARLARQLLAHLAPLVPPPAAGAGPHPELARLAATTARAAAAMTGVAPRRAAAVGGDRPAASHLLGDLARLASRAGAAAAMEQGQLTPAALCNQADWFLLCGALAALCVAAMDARWRGAVDLLAEPCVRLLAAAQQLAARGAAAAAPPASTVDSVLGLAVKLLEHVAAAQESRDLQQKLAQSRVYLHMLLATLVAATAGMLQHASTSGTAADVPAGSSAASPASSSASGGTAATAGSEQAAQPPAPLSTSQAHPFLAQLCRRLGLPAQLLEEAGLWAGGRDAAVAAFDECCSALSVCARSFPWCCRCLVLVMQ